MIILSDACSAENWEKHNIALKYITTMGENYNRLLLYRGTKKLDTGIMRNTEDNLLYRFRSDKLGPKFFVGGISFASHRN